MVQFSYMSTREFDNRWGLMHEDNGYGRDRWIASLVNHRGDGEIYDVVFDTHCAKELALEYVAWKNGGGGVDVTQTETAVSKKV